MARGVVRAAGVGAALVLSSSLFLAVSSVTQLPLRADGTFKIVQFADMHFSRGELATCTALTPEERTYPCSDFNTTDFLARVLDAEQPDLVIFTGDNLAGVMPDPELSIRQYSQVVVDRQIPWLLDREEMLAVVQSIPYSISERGPTDIAGVGNYIVQLYSSTTNVANLYFFDSGAYSEQPGIGGYDWVRPNQIAWYSENSEVIRAANGGRLAPALAFFHIPILEYELVTDKVGDTQEGVFDADLNSGLFTAFVEAGDVKATFVGHDHVNDYCGKYYSLNLCYGGGAGFSAYGQAGWSRRSRIIEFRNNGSSVVTWKRLSDTALTIKDTQTLF